MADYDGALIPLSAPSSAPSVRICAGLLVGAIAVAPDVTVPVVTVVSPAAGATIARTTPIVFTVSDEVALAHVEVRVRQGSTVETVFDGTAFVGAYTRSSVSTASGVMTFSVARRGGWTASPSFSVTPVDTAGNKA